MIKGVHTMFYSSEPEALRVFLRDKLRFPYTDTDGEGWLIFDLPEADMGCHPADDSREHGAPSGTHYISFYCDDVEKTVAELKGRGVRFTDGTRYDVGWGAQTGMKLNLDDSNVLKAHVIGFFGLNSLMADFTPGVTDMVYDPLQNDFQNLLSRGASIGLEHYWTPCLSTTIGGSYIDFDLPDFIDDQFFDYGHKALTNLIWKPQGRLDGVTMGMEWVYASRTDKDGLSTRAHRLIFSGWNDF